MSCLYRIVWFYIVCLQRERDGKSDAGAVFLVLDPDLSTVRANQSLANGQTKPGAAGNA
jgi:hypothetical protein